MTKNRDIGKEILEGLRELKRGQIGRVVNIPPVREIRRKVGLSQSRFAAPGQNRLVSICAQISVNSVAMVFMVA